jgi:DNA recombination protein RmuC
MISSAFLVIILIIFVILNAVFIWFLTLRQKNHEPKDDGRGLELLLTQINELSRTVDNKLGQSSRDMQESFRHQSGESYKVIKDITEKLTRLDETNKQVVGFADQLQSLQDILKNPKQRGILGEYYLETLLKNILPTGGYAMQYQLGQDDAGNKLIPDAVVFIKEKIVPVDSKFSLENYNRLTEEKDPLERERLEKLFTNDLKNRIIETSKYIKPELGTMDFAFMFIPHEAIYYDLLINRVGSKAGGDGEDAENLIQRAARVYKVIVVSPTSFLAYLQTVLQGLRALQIEDSVKGIVKKVGELQRHLKSYEEFHGKLGNALGTAVNQYNSSGREFKKIDKDVLRISGEAINVETLTLERPSVEE